MFAIRTGHLHKDGTSAAALMDGRLFNVPVSQCLEAARRCGLFPHAGCGSGEDQDHSSGLEDLLGNQTENLIESTYDGRCALGRLFTRPGR